MPDLNWSRVEDFTPGFVHKRDVTQIAPGALIIGSKNVVITDGDRVGVRKGSERFGAADTTVAGIKSTHTFKKRDGTNIMLRSHQSVLEYYHTGTSAWENLNDGYTSGKVFGFADHNVNTDADDFVYFCNGEEAYSRWNGQTTQLDGALSGGEATITVDSTTGFTSSGTIRIGTTDVTYSGTTATTFTGCAGTPAAIDNAAVAQAVTEYGSNPKGNILLVKDTRMFVANVKDNNSALFYSKIADATDFTFSSPRVANDGGVIDMPEGGGGINGLALQENTIYALKEDIIKTITFTQDANDLPQIFPLIQSPRVGAKFSLGVFKIDNQVFYVSPEGGIKSVTRVPNIDFVQSLQLSDPTVELVKTMDFSEASGVFFEQKAYIAAKSDGAALNDTVLVYNFQKKAWEAPIFGWNVADWTIYNDELYFGSSTNPEIFKAEVDDKFDDNGFPYSCVARFSYNNFGRPENPKAFNMLFVEGYLSENTTLNVKIRYNYKGGQEIKETSISGSETDYIIAGQDYNLLGNQVLGILPLATIIEDDSPSKLQKFRVYFTTTETPFYELSVEFSSDTEGAQWEILRFAENTKLLPIPVTNIKKKLA